MEQARDMIKPFGDLAPDHLSTQSRKDDEGHVRSWLFSLSDFHKAQCFYSIALQIASFVATNGKNRNRVDELFLLLISADGILPIAIALYTLVLLEQARNHDVVLAGISALLASITGFSIVLAYPSTTTIDGATWPASCGGLSPQGICDTIDFLNFDHNYYANLFFIGPAIALDILMASLVLQYCSPRLMRLRFLTMRARPQMLGRRVGMVLTSALHFGAVLIISICSAIELFFFSKLLVRDDNAFVPRHWSFGQVVGITIWSAVIIDLIRLEVGEWQR